MFLEFCYRCLSNFLSRYFFRNIVRNTAVNSYKSFLRRFSENSFKNTSKDSTKGLTKSSSICFFFMKFTFVFHLYLLGCYSSASFKNASRDFYIRLEVISQIPFGTYRSLTTMGISSEISLEMPPKISQRIYYKNHLWFVSESAVEILQKQFSEHLQRIPFKIHPGTLSENFAEITPEFLSKHP